jgi:hydroxymethylbilane synthase
MPQSSGLIRVGTRGSRLALWQAERVASNLRSRHPGLNVAIVPIESHGDRHDSQAVADLGVVGIFTREIEQALLEDRVDVAVHSLKDMPTLAPPGLEVAALLPRDDPRDVLVAGALTGHPLSGGIEALQALPRGARIATSSLRRRAELLRHRSDLQVIELRGNVPTRLGKVERGEVDGVVLSHAGLLRLGLEPLGRVALDPDVMLPAPAQGTIAIQVRTADRATWARVTLLDDPATRVCTTAERYLLAELEGGCRVPLGALAQLDGDQVTLRARIATVDGAQVLDHTVVGRADGIAALAKSLAATLRARGAMEILATLRER